MTRRQDRRAENGGWEDDEISVGIFVLFGEIVLLFLLVVAFFGDNVFKMVHSFGFVLFH